MEMERLITAFANSANGGQIVTPSAFSAIFRDRIIALATRLKLPAIYFSRYFVVDGGLASYGPDTIDQFRRAVGYVDRILKVSHRFTSAARCDFSASGVASAEATGSVPRPPNRSITFGS